MLSQIKLKKAKYLYICDSKVKNFRQNKLFHDVTFGFREL